MSTTGTPHSSLDLDGILSAVESQTVAYEDALQKLVEKSDPSGGDDLLIRTKMISNLDGVINTYSDAADAASISPAPDPNNHTNKMGSAIIFQNGTTTTTHRKWVGTSGTDAFVTLLKDSVTGLKSDSNLTDFNISLKELFNATDFTDKEWAYDGTTGMKLTTDGLNTFKRDVIELINKAKSTTEQTLDISEATVLTTEVQLEQGKSDLVSGIAKSATDFIKKLAQKMQ